MDGFCTMEKRYINILHRAAFALFAVFALSPWSAAAQAQELPLGSSMPAANTTLQQAGGGSATLSSLTGSAGTVVVFWSNQCPWTDKYQGRLASLQQEFGDQFNFVLINSNNSSAFPQEALGEMEPKRFAEAYLRDNDASVAQAFGAERTPHVFVFDEASTLVYVGGIDDSPGDPGNVERRYLQDALSAVAQGQNVPVAQTKAYGCMIKF